MLHLFFEGLFSGYIRDVMATSFTQDLLRRLALEI